MIDTLRYPEYWLFAAAVIVGLAIVQAIFWRKGKQGRITAGDWSLAIIGLAAGCFAVDHAVKWQDARIVELIQKLVPTHAHLIEDGTRGMIILDAPGKNAPESPGESATADTPGGSNAVAGVEPVETEELRGMSPHGDGAGTEDEFVDQSGMWGAGFVPVTDREGHVKAVLDIDYINSRRSAATEGMRSMATAVVAALFLAITGVIVYFRFRAEYLEAEVRTARALAESEARFRLLFKGSPDAIFVNDPDGFIIDVNPKACDLLQLGSEQLVGRHFADLVDVHHRMEAISNFKKLSEGDTERIEDIQLSTEDGRQIPVAVRVRRILYPENPAYLLHLHDLTDRIALEHELRQAQKMEGIGQLAAGVAHDFNNLLTVIQGHTVMLMENHTGQENLIDSLQEVASAAERAAELTAHLLTFSRKQQMRLEFLDANDVLSNFLRLLGRLIPEHIELHMNTSTRLPSIRADRGMIEQVVTNLAVNARDAMPEGGSLTLSTSVIEFGLEEAFERPETRPGKFVVIKIEDTGMGMSKETRDRIFEPFFTTKDVGKGTGLGLASAYGIIAQHGGWIDVASTVGEGTRFSIYLPARDAACTPTATLPVEEGEVRGGSETILIVEDEPALRELAALNLQRFGYSVIKAASGRDALRMWKDIREDVDLLLTDLVMPDGISGRELGRILTEENSELPVLYMSGYSGTVTGVDDEDDFNRPIIQKPYTPNALARTIRATLDVSLEVRT